MKIYKRYKPELLTLKDTLRPALMCVHLDTDSSEVYATDGHVAGAFKVEVGKNDKSANIPKNVFEGARKGTARIDYEIEISVKEESAEFSNYHYNQKSTLIEHKFTEPFPEMNNEHILGNIGLALSDPGFRIKLNPELLYRIYKAMGKPITGVELVVSNKDCRETLKGGKTTDAPIAVLSNDPEDEGVRCLIMPMRTA